MFGADLFMGGGLDETDGDDEFGGLYLCPFCAEDFDIVGLCCHIDEDHPFEAKNGVSFRFFIYYFFKSHFSLFIVMLSGLC